MSDIGGKGLFAEQIEKELLNEDIDIAVHALKDMPTIETESLLTNNFLKRNSPNEILISKNNTKFEDLAPNSVIGTSSFRREFQLKKKRSDLKYKLIRGNVDTRIQKLENGEFDAILLSKAGIDSLKLQNKLHKNLVLMNSYLVLGKELLSIQCKKTR